MFFVTKVQEPYLIYKDVATVMNVVNDKIDNLSATDIKYNDSTTVKAKIDACMNDVANSKKTVAQTLTSKGVTTADNATFDTIKTNVNTLATNKYSEGYTTGQASVKNAPTSYGLHEEVFVGNYTGNQTSIDITGKYANYAGLTADDFMFKNVTASYTFKGWGTGSVQTTKTVTGGLTASYSNGILTIKGATTTGSSSSQAGGNVGQASMSAKLTYDVYIVR